MSSFLHSQFKDSTFSFNLLLPLKLKGGKKPIAIWLFPSGFYASKSNSYWTLRIALVPKVVFLFVVLLPQYVYVLGKKLNKRRLIKMVIRNQISKGLETKI